MKKRFATFLTLAAAAVFAQDAIIVPAPKSNVVQLDVKPGHSGLPTIEEKVAPKSSSFGYLRMGVSDSQLPYHTNNYVPGIGLGYRLTDGSSAIDISASYNQRKIHTALGTERTYSYTLPRANYLQYLSPKSNNSLYAGAGLAWGGVKTKDQRRFQGLIPNLALGYEMKRKETLRTFAELTVSQPAIAATQVGNLPGPYAELSLGAGF